MGTKTKDNTLEWSNRGNPKNDININPQLKIGDFFCKKFDSTIFLYYIFKKTRRKTMKCIKAIKPQKNVEVGDIQRINDVDAEYKVKTGYWEYVSKTEWRKWKTPPQEEKTEVEKTPKMNAKPKKDKQKK